MIGIEENRPVANQKRTVAESWIERPPPIPLIPVPLPMVLVTLPKVVLVMEFCGLANCGLLLSWNASARVTKETFSQMAKVLKTDRLSWIYPGP